MSIGTLRVIDTTGDTKTIWDTENKAEVETAREAFNKMRAKKYIAYRVKPNGEPGSIMTEFDPNAGMVIMRPQIVGG